MVRELIPYRFTNFPRLRDELFMPIESAFDSIFTDFFSDFKPLSFDNKVKGRIYPKIDAFKDGHDLVIEAAVPFVEPNDLKVELDGGTLILSGSVNSDNETKDRCYYKRELSRSSFRRSFPLSDELYEKWSKTENIVDAQLKNGILTIRLKDFIPTEETAPAEDNPARQIDIKVVDS